MMQRRIAILLATISALTVMAFGMAIGARAQDDVLDTVHALTARFNSVQQAEKAGYVPFYICAEQPGLGTMGQHYVNFDLVGNPAIDPLHPEALVYEPQANGTFKLVALEWVRVGLPEATAPTVLGHDMLYRTAPNRYGIEPGFYERHYWLYQSNPLGDFSDWNPTVSCPLGTGDNGG
jgi:hypothetical protein